MIKDVVAVSDATEKGEADTVGVVAAGFGVMVRLPPKRLIGAVLGVGIKNGFWATGADAGCADCIGGVICCSAGLQIWKEGRSSNFAYGMWSFSFNCCLKSNREAAE